MESSSRDIRRGTSADAIAAGERQTGDLLVSANPRMGFHDAPLILQIEFNSRLPDARLPQYPECGTALEAPRARPWHIDCAHQRFGDLVLRVFPLNALTKTSLTREPA